MTIHELLQAAGLTANDEIPIWDVEATGEPTKKVTAQQLATAVVALANLVTGVKGNAEGSYRTGDVILTPENIGAVAKSGDTMTGPLKWGSGTALPAASSLQYFLGIDLFADGGTTHYITAANMRASLGLKSLRLEAGVPMDNGQVNLGLNTSKIPLSAWSTNNVCQFFVSGSTSTWWVRLSDRTTGAVISGTTTPLPINIKYIDA